MSFENPTFQTRRSAVTVSILLVSADPDLAGVLSDTLLTAPGTRITQFQGRLHDLLTSPRRAESWNVVVFQAENEVARDCTALRAMAGESRFLALIPDAMPDSDRAALAVAGCDEVLPLSAVATAGPVDDATLPSKMPAPDPAAVATPAPALILAPIAAPITTAAPEAIDAPARQPTPAPTASAPMVPQLGTGQVTALLRSRGGAGASTVALNLATALVSGTPKGGPAPRVALVDLDIQSGKLAVMLDLPDSAAFTALIRDRAVPDAAFLDAALVDHGSGLAVLCAPDQFAPLTALTPETVTALIDLLRQRYDHVIVDLPQAVMEWIAPILAAAARILIVTDTSVPSIKQTRRLIEMVAEENMTLPVRVVVNRESRPMFPSAAHKEASRLLARPLNHWIPDDPKAARRAEDLGSPLITTVRRSGASRAIAALAETLRPAVQKPRKS